MNNFYHSLPNGYQDSIEKGIEAVNTLSGTVLLGEDINEENIKQLAQEIKNADAILIGAGSGLSTAAGLTYNGERFEKYFFDFIEKYGIPDMYSGGFYPFPDQETFWAWWARHIYFNRYIDPPLPVYNELFDLVKSKDYFVITTNVDHIFQRAGFDKNRLFYTQGDYGLFQSLNPASTKTYDNEDWVTKAMIAQGFVKDSNGIFQVPSNKKLSMRLPSDLIPKSPDDGSEVKMNLRADNTFLEDKGWHLASKAYADFIKKHKNKRVLYLELGVGGNTPVIIKYPFWEMTKNNENATYACLNFEESFSPVEIADQSICIKADIAEVLDKLKDEMN